MFTKNQIEEIRDKLAQLGVKDTEFKVTKKVFEGDMIAIVSGGENKIIPLKNLLSEAAGNIIIIE